MGPDQAVSIEAFSGCYMIIKTFIAPLEENQFQNSPIQQIQGNCDAASIMWHTAYGFITQSRSCIHILSKKSRLLPVQFIVGDGWLNWNFDCSNAGMTLDCHHNEKLRLCVCADAHMDLFTTEPHKKKMPTFRTLFLTKFYFTIHVKKIIEIGPDVLCFLISV